SSATTSPWSAEPRAPGGAHRCHAGRMEARVPWSSAAGGTLLLAVGLVMLLAVRGPVEVVVLLAAVGLLLAGLVRIVGVHEPAPWRARWLDVRSEEHTSELQSREKLVCRLLLEKKKPAFSP